MSGTRIGTARRLLLGLIAAIAFTLVAMLILSAILIAANIGDNVLTVLNQLVKTAAVVIGVCFAVPKGGVNGLVSGVVIALVYIIAGYACYVALGGGTFTFTGMMGELLLGCAAGALCGAVRANMQSKRKRSKIKVSA